MKPLIKLRNVWKVYQLGKVEVPAVRALSMEIMPGDFAVLMGASGSGKSTAMHLIGCLDIPTRGTVYLSGQDVAELSESELAQIRAKKIGFVFQRFNLLPSLSALENVMLPMLFQETPEQEARERAKLLLDSVGLNERAAHRPSELSGGEQQRVAIARALANDPEIILADEPTGNLDSKSGRSILSLLAGLHKQKGKTIVLVTHDSELARYGEKIYKLRDGSLE